MTRIFSALILVMLSLSSFSYAAGESDAPKDPAIKALLDKERMMNDRCKGGFGDSVETKKYCKERDKTFSDLKKKGWCWGYPGQIEADKVWHDCKDKTKLEKKSPYYLSLETWKCPKPESLTDNRMYDKDSGCLVPSGKTPENIVVMDVEQEFAYVCVPFRSGKEFIEGFTSIRCNYVLVSSIMDKNGQHPDLEKLKADASKQTMKDVKDLK